jgi:hypothetical protein
MQTTLQAGGCDVQAWEIFLPEAHCCQTCACVSMLQLKLGVSQGGRPYSKITPAACVATLPLVISNCRLRLRWICKVRSRQCGFSTFLCACVTLARLLLLAFACRPALSSVSSQVARADPHPIRL